MSNITKNMQSSHYLGGWISEVQIAQMLAAGYTNAQIAFQIGVLPADVARVLALSTPT